MGDNRYLNLIHFELNSKRVVEFFHEKNIYIQFGIIINICDHLFNTFYRENMLSKFYFKTSQ